VAGWLEASPSYTRREAAFRYLGRASGKYPAAKSALTQAFRTESSGQLQGLISRYVTAEEINTAARH
jgi:hypothetical protein